MGGSPALRADCPKPPKGGTPTKMTRVIQKSRIVRDSFIVYLPVEERQD
jgi:hypothetical protein